MASKTIKGLTVEIGGDTTKLGQALEKVNRKSRDLTQELGYINGLLKMDPVNVELLSQKQKVLAEAIANTSGKLETLREAEKQVQKQFERGEVSEEQVRALQREIIATTKKLDSYEKAAKNVEDTFNNLANESDNVKGGAKDVKKGADQASDSLDDYADSAEKAEKASDGLSRVGGIVGKGLAAVSAIVAAATASLIASAEASREYRREMGKLSTAFETAGHDGETAANVYRELQGILGETDQAVEASNHLAKLCDNEEELSKMTEAATGVYATFGASLPIENLAEAANETAKTGTITGGLADALNWAGESEEEFQAKLDACSDEQERQTLIINTLNHLYSEAAGIYRETNAEVIRANEANEAWASSLAEVGGAIEPILTDVKTLGASLLSDVIPGIKEAAEASRGILDGDTDAADSLGTALSGVAAQLLNKITRMTPAAVEVGTSLVTSLTTTLISMTPQLVETGIGLAVSVLDGLTSATPRITQALVDMIPKLVKSLQSGTPQLIDGALGLLLAVVTAVDLLLPPLIEAVPGIVTCIIEGLLGAAPQLIDGALLLLLSVCDAIPLLVEELAPLIPTIVTTVILGLLDCTPQLLEAAMTLMNAIPRAIPGACAALIKALPQIGKTILSYFQALPGKVVSIGRALIEGLWQGITDSYTWLEDKLGGWGDDVTDFLQKLFGIHSPSKVTAWIGEMLDEGLAIGIENNAKTPMDAMSTLSNQMLGEAGELDGMAIERQINHSYSATVPAAAMQSTDMIGKLDQILQAIRDGHILVIDGDKLVGATYDRMDEKLGQKRILSERGAV